LEFCTRRSVRWQVSFMGCDVIVRPLLDDPFLLLTPFFFSLFFRPPASRRLDKNGPCANVKGGCESSSFFSHVLQNFPLSSLFQVFFFFLFGLPPLLSNSRGDRGGFNMLLLSCRSPSPPAAFCGFSILFPLFSVRLPFCVRSSIFPSRSVRKTSSPFFSMFSTAFYKLAWTTFSPLLFFSLFVVATFFFFFFCADCLVLIRSVGGGLCRRDRWFFGTPPPPSTYFLNKHFSFFTDLFQKVVFAEKVVFGRPGGLINPGHTSQRTPFNALFFFSYFFCLPPWSKLVPLLNVGNASCRVSGRETFSKFFLISSFFFS